MPNALRTLRRIAATKWQVIIDTHTAADLAPDPDYDRPEVTGQRPLGEPVAVIIERNGLFVAFDRQEAELGSDSDLRNLARRIADGEFDNDFRFEYFANPEPSSPSDLYYMSSYATPSQRVIDRYTMDDPGRDIQAAREAQVFTPEERFDMYAARGW